MPSLGKIFLFAMIQLFVFKAVCTGILPILKSDQQLWVLEESQENEESDDTFELKFTDDFIDFTEQIELNNQLNFSSTKKAYASYNASLYIGHPNQSFRPPCA
jgi:hypothetical protein